MRWLGCGKADKETIVQTLRFKLRPLQEEDLQECLSLEPNYLGGEIVGFDRALDIWKSMVGRSAFGANVIEADPPLNGQRIFGFGLRVFVTRDFADAEVSNPRPGLFARLVATVADGSPAFLNDSQIRTGNTHSGLDAVILGGFRFDTLSVEDLRIAGATLAARFFQVHSAYWLNRMITETASPQYKDFLLATRVWKTASSFTEFYAQHPNSGWPLGRELAIITRDEAMKVTSHSIGPLFIPKKPRLRLTEADQQFLRIAVTGLTDEGLSGELDVSVSAIKKRWLSLYERITDAHPDFFPHGSGGLEAQTRGRQKRHLLIAYIRSHPEELSPFDW